MRVRVASRETVVHEDDFVVKPGERGGEFALEDGDVFLFVVERDDDGKSRHGGSYSSSPW